LILARGENRGVASSDDTRSIRGLAALACVLFVAAVAVRGIPAQRVRLPEDAPVEKPRIAEPMQLLSRGASLRVAELDPLVRTELRPSFVAARGIVFAMDDCPALVEWMQSAEGQRAERLLTALRAGSTEEALAALTLVFQIARATDWEPGLTAHAEHAERLGALLQDWLRVWGERAATDPLLVEPALGAMMLYGRAMREAWRAPVLGYNEAPYSRAHAFLMQATGLATSKRTALGEALQARFARVASRLSADVDALMGLEEECAAFFPDLTGGCE
jgi:hypothetical protein